MTRPVAAYQLSLLGDGPKPGRQWRPTLWAWEFGGGLAIPPTDEALRQFRMMQADTQPAEQEVKP